MEQRQYHAWTRYLVAVFSFLLATVIRLGLSALVGDGVPFIFYYPAVMFSAWFGRFGPSLLSLVLSILAAEYLFSPPRKLLFIFFLGSLLSSILIEALHRANGRIEQLRKREKEQREKLRESQQRLRTMADSAPVMMWIGGLDKRCHWVNKSRSEFTGEAIGENESTECFDQVHPEDFERCNNEYLKAFETRRDFSLEYRLRRADGEYRWVLDNCTSLRDQTGNFTGYIGSAVDISERKQVEEIILKEKKFSDTTIESLPGIFYVISIEGRFLRWNKNFEKVSGYAAKEISEMHPLDFFSEAEKPMIAERIQQVFVTGEATAEATFITKDGKGIPHFFTGKLIAMESGPCLVGMGIDISERLRAEKEREELLIREQEARAVAEAARRRSDLLAQASEILATTLDYEVTLKHVAQLAIPHFADWCTVDVVNENGAIQRVAIAHTDPAKIELAEEFRRRYPPESDGPHGVPKIMRTGQAELHAVITDEMLVRGAQDAAQLDLLRAMGIRSAMLVPVLARGKILGVITFVNGESNYHYTKDDLGFAQVLAHRVALAIDNALLYREAQDALRKREEAFQLHRSVEDRLYVLAEASNRLLGMLRIAEVQPAILDLASRLIAADAYALWRKHSQSAAWRIVAAVGLSENFQARVVKAGEYDQNLVLENPVVIEDVRQLPWQGSRKEANEAEGIRSLLVIPLQLQDEFAGTITYYYRHPHKFSELEIRVATALANLAAAAINSTEIHEEQIRLRSEAEEASRLKDEFLSTVSHELRTPLHSILGWTRLLRGGKLSAEESRRALEIVERNAISQNELIEDILDVSRIITGKLRLELEMVSLPFVIDAAIDSVRPATEAKEITIQKNLTEKVIQIWADPHRIQQIIWNLLSNAIKFTEPGGRVDVSLEHRVSSIEIRIADTGAGIKPEFLPFVFDRFRQADSSTTRAQGGLGLGLAIVRHLSELHGGTVHAESAGVGQGSTFRVNLPIVATRNEVKPAQPSPMLDNSLAKAAELSGVRILVVDDEEDARDLLMAVLLQSGAEVRAVSSTAETFYEIENWKPDLLVADIGMPGEDGYSLIRKLKMLPPDRGGNIPAIALTAYARGEDRLQSLYAGYKMHLAKPVNQQELVLAIANLLGRAW